MAAKAGSKTPGAGHNDPPAPLTQDEIDALFVVHLAQARQDDDALEKANEAVRAVKKIRNRNRNTMRTDGFPLKQVDEILSDEQLPRHEVEDREAKRGNMRRVANQPGGALIQPDLFDDSFTQNDKDKEYWRANGYTAGLRGLENKLPDDMAADFAQDWQEGWTDGQSVLGKALATKKSIDARGAGAQ